MTQAEIQNETDVVRYLREYAIRMSGAQPLAVGVKPAAFEAITREIEARLCLQHGVDAIEGLNFVRVCDVKIVSV